MQLGPAAHRMLAEMVADMLVSRDMLNFGDGKQNATAAANQTLAQPPTKPAPGLRKPTPSVRSLASAAFLTASDTKYDTHKCNFTFVLQEWALCNNAFRTYVNVLTAS